jgi:hypothetical protein
MRPLEGIASVAFFKSGQEIAVGQELGGQVRNRHRGQKIPSPVCVGMAWIGNAGAEFRGRVTAGIGVKDCGGG